MNWSKNGWQKCKQGTHRVNLKKAKCVETIGRKIDSSRFLLIQLSSATEQFWKSVKQDQLNSFIFIQSKKANDTPFHIKIIDHANSGRAMECTRFIVSWSVAVVAQISTKRLHFRLLNSEERCCFHNLKDLWPDSHRTNTISRKRRSRSLDCLNGQDWAHGRNPRKGYRQVGGEVAQT